MLERTHKGPAAQIRPAHTDRNVIETAKGAKAARVCGPEFTFTVSWPECGHPGHLYPVLDNPVELSGGQSRAASESSGALGYSPTPASLMPPVGEP